MNDLHNKTVVLTGASGGIGAPLAKALARQGARLILVGRNRPRLEQLARDLDPKHKIIAADLTDTEGMHRFATACAREERIDILINSAGVNEFALLEDLCATAIQRILHTNLMVPMLTCKALLPQLEQQPGAVILNIGSTFGSIGYPGYSAYCASKFGLRGFTESLRREVIHTGIRVHYLSPRAVKTDMNSAAVNALNQALDNTTDEPAVVVAAALKLLRCRDGRDRFLGWPERFFVKINGLFPGLVTQSIAKQLATIRKFAVQPLRQR